MASSTIHKARDIIEAGILISLLDSYDIMAFSVDQHMNTMHLGGNIFAPVRILVNPEDAEHAKKIIADYFSGELEAADTLA